MLGKIISRLIACKMSNKGLTRKYSASVMGEPLQYAILNYERGEISLAKSAFSCVEKKASADKSTCNMGLPGTFFDRF